MEYNNLLAFLTFTRNEIPTFNISLISYHILEVMQTDCTKSTLEYENMIHKRDKTQRNTKGKKFMKRLRNLHLPKGKSVTKQILPPTVDFELNLHLPILHETRNLIPNSSSHTLDISRQTNIIVGNHSVTQEVPVWYRSPHSCKKQKNKNLMKFLQTINK